MFTDLEQKLLRLALDAAAEPGEIRNSSIMLIRSLRARGIGAEGLIFSSERQIERTTALERARRLQIPFGKYRGQRLDMIRPNYLRWVLRECANLSLSLREAIELVLSARQGGPL